MRAVLGALVALVMVAGTAAAGLPQRPMSYHMAMARMTAGNDTALAAVLARVWAGIDAMEWDYVYRPDAVSFFEAAQIGETTVEQARRILNDPAHCHVSGELLDASGIEVLSIGDANGNPEGIAIPVGTLAFKDGVLYSKSFQR